MGSELTSQDGLRIAAEWKAMLSSDPALKPLITTPLEKWTVDYIKAGLALNDRRGAVIKETDNFEDAQDEVVKTLGIYRIVVNHEAKTDKTIQSDFSAFQRLMDQGCPAKPRALWQGFKKKHPGFENSRAVKVDLGPKLDKFEKAALALSKAQKAFEMAEINASSCYQYVKKIGAAQNKIVHEAVVRKKLGKASAARFDAFLKDVHKTWA